MLVKKAHTRCQFAKCTDAKDAYAFYPSDTAGHRPVILCKKHLNEMVAEVKKLEKKEKEVMKDEQND